MTTKIKLCFSAFILVGATALLFSGCKKEDEKKAPLLHTTAVTSITATTATSGGNITADGGAPVTACGVVWSTSQNPIVESNQGITSDGSGTSTWVSELVGLQPNDTYYVRAYATNIAGTGYGNQQTFTTFDGQSLLTTRTVTDITATTATSGGNISHDGGASITARGVVWSTSQNPTIENNQGITANGTGTSSFSCNLSGLMGSTLYYVRAYATNSFGTQYGNQLFFETLIADGTTGTVTYHDYTYQTVYINQREWFAENLRTTKYRNGTDIPNVTSNSSWAGLSTPAYCWYNNDQTNYGNTYGALYNWYTVNTGNLCPTGWHVPTDAEWTALTDYVGEASVAGNKLKATSGWSSGGNGTDEYGFSALPGGDRASINGIFYSVGLFGHWWSSTEHDATTAWSRHIRYDTGYLYRFSKLKRNGFSVRCVRDN